MGIPVLNGFFSSSSLQICLLSLLFSSKHLQSALSCIYIWSGQLATYSSRILLFGSLEATLLLNDPLDFDSRSDYNLSWSVYTFHNWVDLNDAIVPSCLFIELIQFSILHVCWTMLSITCGISELLRVFLVSMRIITSLIDALNGLTVSICSSYRRFAILASKCSRDKGSCLSNCTLAQKDEFQALHLLESSS
jgi:hypothetical protein